MRECWIEVKWESMWAQEREEEGERREVRGRRLSKAFLRFCFFVSMRFRASEIEFREVDIVVVFEG